MLPRVNGRSGWCLSQRYLSHVAFHSVLSYILLSYPCFDPVSPLHHPSAKKLWELPTASCQVEETVRYQVPGTRCQVEVIARCKVPGRAEWHDLQSAYPSGHSHHTTGIVRKYSTTSTGMAAGCWRTSPREPASKSPSHPRLMLTCLRIKTSKQISNINEK